MPPCATVVYGMGLAAPTMICPLPLSIPLMLGDAEAFTQRPHSLPFGF
jgi:hypothetical protein